MNGLKLRLVTAVSVVVLLPLGGCPDEVETSCQPGVTNPCQCADGASGISTCGDDNTFGTCVCDDPDAGDVSGDAQTDSNDGAIDDSLADSSETGGGPPAPTNVSASDGTYANEVEVAWDESEGATSYSILRDETEIATGIETTVYHDTTAQQATPGGGVALNLEASSDVQEQILLSWDQAEVPTVTHSYQVVAVNSDGSTASTNDAGYRQAVQVDRYELRVDEAGDWVSLGAVFEHEYAVTTPSLYAQIESIDVASTLTSVTVTANATTGSAQVLFEVRGVNSVGPGEPSTLVGGFALPPSFVYRWDRSTDASYDPTFAPIVGANDVSYEDEDVATNGEGRRYRYVISVGDHGTVTSETLQVSRVIPIFAPTELEAGSHFGASVAFEGNHLVVGAPGHGDSGAAWIFAYNGTTSPYFEELASISSGLAGQQFGTSVAVEDGIVVAGATTETATSGAYIYSTAGVLLEGLPDGTEPNAATNSYGSTVAITGDYVFVADTGYNSNQGDVYVYHTTDDATWIYHQTAFPSMYVEEGDQYGASMSVYGDNVAIGAPADETDSGYVFPFARNGDNWPEFVASPISPTLDSHGYFGTSVSYRHPEILVGAPSDSLTGGAFYSEWAEATGWSEVALVSPGDRVEGEEYGTQVILGDEHTFVSSPGANGDMGRIAIFDEVGAAFVLRESLTEVTLATDRRFGESMTYSHGWLFVGIPTDNDGRGAVLAYYLGLD